MSSQGGNVIAENVVNTFLAWTNHKIYYDSKGQPPFYFFEREIWWVALGKNIGREIDGKNTSFRRPVIILKKYSVDTCFVVPLTTQVKPNWQYHFPFHFNGRDMAAVLCQARTISSRRLLHKMGKLNTIIFKQISEEFAKNLK